jgi:hypothetical protein
VSDMTTANKRRSLSPDVTAIVNGPYQPGALKNAAQRNGASNEDGWRTAVVLAIVPAIFAVLFAVQLAKHGLPLDQIVFGIATTFGCLYAILDRLRTSWKKATRAEQDGAK